MKDPIKSKIVNLKKLERLVSNYSKEGKRIGCLSGSFDVLAARHYRSFFECSQKCDILIILLNSDESIRQYKGPSKPILAQNERSYLVAQSTFVTHVLIFDELTPVSVLERIKPDVFFNTSEWGEGSIERPTVEKNGGVIDIFDVHLEDAWVKSSSEMIRRIISSENMEVQKAVFLDRDGVINKNGAGYIYKWDDFKFLPYVVSSLKRLQKAGYLLFIITNQSGIGRGIFTEKDLVKLNRKIISYLKEQGVNITAIYYCPHHPDAGCACRKPEPGMLIQASKQFDLNLSKSWMIGDSGSDIDAGRQVNTQTVQILHKDSETNGRFKPRFIVKNIKEATDSILSLS